MKRIWVSIATVAMAVILTSCGSDSSTSTSTPAPSEKSAVDVAVTVKEWSINPAPLTVNNGEVRFSVKNSGSTVHEFVVVKTDDDPARLPVYQASDKVAEGHAVGDVDEEQSDVGR